MYWRSLISIASELAHYPRIANTYDCFLKVLDVQQTKSEKARNVHFGNLPNQCLIPLSILSPSPETVKSIVEKSIKNPIWAVYPGLNIQSSGAVIKEVRAPANDIDLLE